MKHKPNWQWQLIEVERPRQVGAKPLRNEVIVEGTLYARTSGVAKQRAFNAYIAEYEEKHDIKRIWLMPWIPKKEKVRNKIVVDKDVLTLIEHRHLFARDGVRLNLVLTKIKGQPYDN